MTQLRPAVRDNTSALFGLPCRPPAFISLLSALAVSLLPALTGRPEQHVITGIHSHLREEDHCTILGEPAPASPAPRQASSVQLFISLPFVNEHNFLSLQYNKPKVNCTKRNAIVKIYMIRIILEGWVVCLFFSSFVFLAQAGD